jgi:hypothetical protein
LKKIIFLVDGGNSHFLVIKNNGNFVLPTLNFTKEIDKKIYNKYKIEIKSQSVLKETNKYIVIKCYADKLPNENLFVIKDLANLITVKEQKGIILEYEELIFIETLNDSFWLGILLSVEDQVKNVEIKYILSEFLIMYSSIFCKDVIEYKLGGIKEGELLTEKQLKSLRNYYLKECPLYNSPKIKETIKNMDINFNEYVFDIVLFLEDGKLLDINSRFWIESKSNLKSLYNSIIMSSRKWIINLMPKKFSDIVETSRKCYIDEYKKRISNIYISQRSYSTYKLFNNKLSENEKSYILQRIGLLKTTIFISKIIGKDNIISSDIKNDKHIIFDSNRFVNKIKASIIEMIWNDKKGNKLKFLDSFFEKERNEIPNIFYSINRKCRNNIHYGFYNSLTTEEYDILNKYQDLYILSLIDEMEKNIKYNFGFKYVFDLGLAKLNYWSKH